MQVGGCYMIYVKTEDLKVGMRLAKPIYNRKGILLYKRNDKITSQGIESVKNFGFIGLYILEPAEPLPPMSDEEIEFERFQTMAVFSLKEDLDHIIQGKKPENLIKQTDEIVRRFGKVYHKMNFNQNLRSPEDYVYKHVLNVAILAALISNRASFGIVEQTEIVTAALLHDVGKLLLPPEFRVKTNQLSPEEENTIAKAVVGNVEKMSNTFDLPVGVKSMLMQFYQFLYLPEKAPATMTNAVKILLIANAYDEFTAMKLGEEPQSEVATIRKLMADESLYAPEMVSHLINSIKILYPGVCVELTNSEKGLVIRENTRNVLKPIVLGFGHNEIYNLDVDGVYDRIQIKDIMKTMDNRIKIDPERLKEYQME